MLQNYCANRKTAITIRTIKQIKLTALVEVEEGREGPPGGQGGAGLPQLVEEGVGAALQRGDALVRRVLQQPAAQRDGVGRRARSEHLQVVFFLTRSRIW